MYRHRHTHTLLLAHDNTTLNCVGRCGYALLHCIIIHQLTELREEVWPLHRTADDSYTVCTCSVRSHPHVKSGQSRATLAAAIFNSIFRTEWRRLNRVPWENVCRLAKRRGPLKVPVYIIADKRCYFLISSSAVTSPSRALTNTMVTSWLLRMACRLARMWKTWQSALIVTQWRVWEGLERWTGSGSLFVGEEWKQQRVRNPTGACVVIEVWWTGMRGALRDEVVQSAYHIDAAMGLACRMVCSNQDTRSTLPDN